jgi:nucleotide-binding universal stress UspA family protein
MAIGLARTWEAALHICYVTQVAAAAQMGAIALPIAPQVGANEGGELRRAVSDELARNVMTGEFSERKGDVARELEALAESCRADLVVVGRSRHPALHLGGVPRRALAMGHRPVLVVP